MKKKMKVILTASMLSAAAATAAFAEGPGGPGGNMGQAPQMEGQQVPGGNQQPPQMNGQQAPQGENNAQPPQMNERRGRISFEEYVENGTISQETCDGVCEKKSVKI